jgi:hypothetical protein
MRPRGILRFHFANLRALGYSLVNMLRIET